MSTTFTTAKKIKSGILHVNHIQENNPPKLYADGEKLVQDTGLKIIHNRSGIYINSYKDFFVLVKRVKSFFNVTTEVAEHPQAVQMLKSFDSDFFGFISSINGTPESLIHNSHLPSQLFVVDKNDAVGPALAAITNSQGNSYLGFPSDIENKSSGSDKIYQNKNAFAPSYDVIFHREATLKHTDPDKMIFGNYFMPIPQALSNFQERSDIIPLSVDMQDIYEKVYFRAGQYFLVANFASHLMAAALDKDNFKPANFLTTTIGDKAPDKKIVTQHGVQFWVEIYTED